MGAKVYWDPGPEFYRRAALAEQRFSNRQLEDIRAWGKELSIEFNKQINSPRRNYYEKVIISITHIIHIIRNYLRILRESGTRKPR